jgi:RND family efflux transporter MFP subunit
MYVRLLALLVPLALLLSGCGSEEASGGERRGDEENASVPAVEAVQAQRGALPLRERLTGTVRATGQVAIYPDGAGRIVQVLAENGERVRRGEPLVRLKAESSQSQLEQARANLEVVRAQAQEAKANLAELKSQFKRTKKLAEDDLVSQQKLETQRAQLESARASYQQAKAQVQQAKAQINERQEDLSQTVVRAPISGRIGQRDAEVGMQVSSQTQLFTMGRMSEVQVEVPVTQEMISKMSEGQTVELTLGSRPDTVITAEVSRLSPFLEEGSFSAEAEIDVPNEDGLLRPGMFVTADVLYGESERATLVPKSALYENPGTGTQGVYVATSLGSETQPAEPGADGKGPLTAPTPAQFRTAEVVAEGRQLVGVRGLEPGAWVMVVGQHLLSGQGPAQARVRPVSWDRIIDLQRLQRQDLLRQFMKKQQRLTRQRADSTTA